MTGVMACCALTALTVLILGTKSIRRKTANPAEVAENATDMIQSS